MPHRSLERPPLPARFSRRAGSASNWWATALGMGLPCLALAWFAIDLHSTPLAAMALLMGVPTAWFVHRRRYLTRCVLTLDAHGVDVSPHGASAPMPWDEIDRVEYGIADDRISGGKVAVAITAGVVGVVTNSLLDGSSAVRPDPELATTFTLVPRLALQEAPLQRPVRRRRTLRVAGGGARP